MLHVYYAEAYVVLNETPQALLHTAPNHCLSERPGRGYDVLQTS
jgi:hypothetical protein